VIFRVVPTVEQVQYCKDFLKKGGTGNRKDFDGDYLQQLFGLQAEVIICDILGVKRHLNQGFDGGYDIISQGKHWDVKCEIRSTMFKSNIYVHNLSGHQAIYPCDGLIFMNYNKEVSVFEICGWINKTEFLQKSRYYDEGTSRTRSDGSAMIVKGRKGMYEISQRELKSFETFLNPSNSVHQKMLECADKKLYFSIEMLAKKT
jgi:hypothetical protein